MLVCMYSCEGGFSLWAGCVRKRARVREGLATGLRTGWATELRTA